MQLIERYAYTNRLRTVPPDHKAAVALLVLLLCLALDRPAVSIACIAWMFLLVVPVAGVPARTFGRVLVVEGGFILMTIPGILISIGPSAPSDSTAWSWPLGPLWISTSAATLWQGIALVMRALGCAAAMNFLALTTPLVDIIELLRRWHIPSVLIDIMTVTYRSIFVLLESANTMYIAQDSRLGYLTSRMRAIHNAALLASRLFVEAYRRGKELQIALESRGFNGDLRVLPMTYRFSPLFTVLGAVIMANLVLLWAMA
ncbi:MAG: cobalt ECF transporter T component CbiQ [Anaerolineae bacterium]|nr:cobalt ECF transporter T component CbiQ [Anaerolineae bacterium]MDW8070924.1 cobalt ECF transporter T component CbiQ [Anaerolineae bacterium]